MPTSISEYPRENTFMQRLLHKNDRNVSSWQRIGGLHALNAHIDTSHTPIEGIPNNSYAYDVYKTDYYFGYISCSGDVHKHIQKIRALTKDVPIWLSYEAANINGENSSFNKDTLWGLLEKMGYVPIRQENITKNIVAMRLLSISNSAYTNKFSVALSYENETT